MCALRLYKFRGSTNVSSSVPQRINSWPLRPHRRPFHYPSPLVTHVTKKTTMTMDMILMLIMMMSNTCPRSSGTRQAGMIVPFGNKPQRLRKQMFSHRLTNNRSVTDKNDFTFITQNGCESDYGNGQVIISEVI